MIKEVEIKVIPAKVFDETFTRQEALNRAGIKDGSDVIVQLQKRSIDARGKQVYYLLRFKIFIKEEPIPYQAHHLRYKNVSNAKRVVIVGAGPAGYWAALELIELGYKPIVLDRGKDVRERRRDLKAIQQDGVVNPHSNYCFGEGGAGTYSDGKLYTRSHKRGSIIKVLEQLVDHGANPEILVEAHPHIGSNKLPGIIAAMRETILTFGGEVHFNSWVTDFATQSNEINAVVCADGDRFEASAFVLATGHSARDIFYLLHQKNILIEAKPFALGLRIEHAQNYIDHLQYGQKEREENLPAASYKAVCQVADKGVFSFCMCPGGLIVPAATAPGEIVVNGMSLSRRDSPFANSGFVTSIELDELQKHGYSGVFGALDFQQKVEQNMFGAGDGSQKAPAQRVDDFVNGKTSSTLPATSYIPGLFSAPLQELLPSFVSKRLRNGIVEINKKMKGYLTADAIVVGTESRTSSPIRIPRGDQNLMHPQMDGLFPCGEGAGYAGGILSAAMDGQNVAQAIDRYLKSK
ncbi:MAG TPA: FAD-binding protein [Saprospiraceae bacterium]|nr:FAD-binding protein [Saprospiraceae bacterium]